MSGLLQAQQEDNDTTVKMNKLSEVDTVVATPPPQEEFEEVDIKAVEKNSDEEYFIKRFPEDEEDPFVVRKLSDSIMNAMKNDDAFWYANKSFKKKQVENDGGKMESISFFETSGFRTLLIIIIIIGFASLLAIYLSGNSVGLFRKSKTIAQAESEEETEDIFAINYQKEIDKATAAGNYRLAIRLMFLRVLRGLADKNVIKFTQDKTNFDYLLQLNNTPWYANFFRLTRNYEYAWYGHFDVDKEKFNVIKKEFESFERQL
ncbi:MAG: hypothetical protein WDN26_11500 [Chitinophagaceae bacterium]